LKNKPTRDPIKPKSAQDPKMLSAPIGY
jgi:hypothetical protein